MAKAAGSTAGKTARRRKQIVLTVDVGGSHVKVMTSKERKKHAADSGDDMTAEEMVRKVKSLARNLEYDAIAIGYPGLVAGHRPTAEPFNLGSGWVDFDFEAALGKPVRVVNDALMQAIGSYEGGRMLFLGLGTGLGSAMIVENVALPMELAHLPYKKKHRTFEDYVGERGIDRRGKKKWRKSVFDVCDRLQAALQPDEIVIGGGNVDELDELPPRCRRGDNELAFEGGFRLWFNPKLKVA